MRRFLPEDKVESIQGLALTADQRGAVFDVAAADVDLFLAGMYYLFIILTPVLHLIYKVSFMMFMFIYNFVIGSQCMTNKKAFNIT